MDYIQLFAAFIGGVLSKKVFEQLIDRLLSGLGGIGIIGYPQIDYKTSDSTYSYYKYADECWLEIPFVISCSIHNNSKRAKTVFNPLVEFHVPYTVKVAYDYVPLFSGGSFFTTLTQKAFTVPSDGHIDIQLFGFARFFANGDRKGEIENVAYLALNNIDSITLRLKRTGAIGSELKNRTKVTYERFDDIKSIAKYA